MVASLAGQMNARPQRGEGGESGNRSSEEVLRSKGKSLDQAEGVAAGRGEPGTGHGIGTGGWAPANSSLPASGEWQGNRRLEMPVFNGENPDGWLFRAERYFNINRLTEVEKMATVGVSLDGDARSWLQWTEV